MMFYYSLVFPKNLLKSKIFLEIIIIGICIILIVFGAVFYVRKKSGSEEE